MVLLLRLRNSSGMKKKSLYKAEISLPEPGYGFLKRFGLVEEMPTKEDYRYAYSDRQARLLFEKIYPPDSILKITKEIRTSGKKAKASS